MDLCLFLHWWLYQLILYLRGIIFGTIDRDSYHNKYASSGKACSGRKHRSRHQRSQQRSAGYPTPTQWEPLPAYFLSNFLYCNRKLNKGDYTNQILRKEKTDFLWFVGSWPSLEKMFIFIPQIAHWKEILYLFQDMPPEGRINSFILINDNRAVISCIGKFGVK